VRFFDASAVVKRYVRERESTAVRRLLRAGDVAVSRLSEIEVVSALARLEREAAISRPQRNRAIAAFTTDLAAWHVVELSPDVVATARTLLVRHVLRAGDAIQLASAHVLRTALGQDLEALVAYDQRVLTAAHAEQFTVVGN